MIQRTSTQAPRFKTAFPAAPSARRAAPGTRPALAPQCVKAPAAAKRGEAFKPVNAQPPYSKALTESSKVLTRRAGSSASAPPALNNFAPTLGLAAGFWFATQHGAAASEAPTGVAATAIGQALGFLPVLVTIVIAGTFNYFGVKSFKEEVKEIKDKVTNDVKEIKEEVKKINNSQEKAQTKLAELPAKFERANSDRKLIAKDLRTEINTRANDTDTRIDKLATDLRTEIKDLRTEMSTQTAELRTLIEQQTAGLRALLDVQNTKIDGLTAKVEALTHAVDEQRNGVAENKLAIALAKKDIEATQRAITAIENVLRERGISVSKSST